MTAQSVCAFEFELTQNNRVMVISLSGKLDPVAAEELVPHIQEAQRAGVRRFVFDLKQLDYVGSLGLRLFVGLHNEVKNEGAVVLCSASAPVRTILDMTKLNRVLRFYPTRIEAVDALNS